MVIVFDVNGTLLDTSVLAPLFQRIFGTDYSVRQWFTELIQHSMALTLAGDFHDFGDIGAAVLEAAAAGRGIRLSHADGREVRKTMQALPPFPEVPDALARLRAAGHRLAALSNSGPAALPKQLRNAGLEGYFESAISVAGVKRYKPAPEVYRLGARRLGIRTRDMLMVAAHPWDLLGAARAGCRTALIARPGVVPFPLAPAPDIVAADLSAFAAKMEAPHRPAFHRASGAGSLVLAAALAAGIAAALLEGRCRTPPATTS